jgi:AcrR family transcriptional regulator
MATGSRSTPGSPSGPPRPDAAGKPPRTDATGRPLRADAARNRAKVLAAAAEVFGQRGLDAPLEHIARQAGVSIGTLYAHFPTREAFFDAIIPERLAALDQITADSLADPDPWNGFVHFVENLFGLRARDRGFNDALAQRASLSPQVAEACRRGMGQAETIIDRAKHSGQLRADFQLTDLGVLSQALSHVIRESADANVTEWRRCLAFLLDGLKAEAATTAAPT